MRFHIEERKKHIILIILLIALTILARLQYDHQTDFDSYRLLAQAESIQLEGYAPWIYHPISLIGYYPLSYPSGVMYFQASMSALTGLSMLSTVQLFGLFNAVMIVLLVLLVARKYFKSWMIGYLAGLIVATSPLMLHYTGFNASGRAFVMIFYLLFLWLTLYYYETKSRKYLLLSVIVLIFSLLAHRTSQLIIVFIMATIIAAIYLRLPKLYVLLNKSRNFGKYFHTRYQKNRYWVVFDIAIVIILLAIVKLIDLFKRDRFTTNIQSHLIEPVTNALPRLHDYFYWILVVVVVLIVIIIILWKVFKQNIFKKSVRWVNTHYHRTFEKPDFYFSIVLLIITVYFFVDQFFGGSFYAPSLQDFYSSDLLSGRTPWVVMINFLINYTTAVTTLFIFYFIGFIALLLKKRKTYSHWVLIFSFTAFSSIMLDKNYVRAFLIPFVAIVTAYGIYSFYSWMLLKSKKSRSKIFMVYTIIFFVSLLIVSGLFLPIVRTSLFDERDFFEDNYYYWQTGQFIRSLDCDCSTLTTKEQVAGVVIMASSGVPGGSHNVYYYVHDDKLQFESTGLVHAWEQIRMGKKLESLWSLPDWIFGGEYYVGRHAAYLFGRSFNDLTTQRIMHDYDIKYYTHDHAIESNVFHESIRQVSNVVYTNPLTTTYDLEKGKQGVKQ